MALDRESPPPRFRAPGAFSPALGAQGPHAQTILGSLLRPGRHVPARRERWTTPDGDFLDVDHVQAKTDAPHVLVLHGLEGSSRAGYVLETLRGIGQRGWGAVALNFRSCSGEPNVHARSYNSGDPTDALFTLAQMRERLGIRGPLFGVGFSLGGSVLLNLVAKTGEASPLDGAAAVSVPFDLSRCADLLDHGPGLTFVYKRMFLASLKAKTLGRMKAEGGAVLDASRIRAAHTIRAFDDAVTAPLFGYASAEDYYADCSTAPKLQRIVTPTVLVTADDDPIAPATCLPDDVGDNPWLSVVRTSRGGHVGFIAGSLRRPMWWGEGQALAYFDHLLASAPGSGS